jgi:DNA-binding transcriptional regulator YdaS (Cro superfamily)
MPRKKISGPQLLDEFLQGIGDARTWAKRHGISESHLSRLRRGERTPSTLMRAHLAKATRGKVAAEAWA